MKNLKCDQTKSKFLSQLKIGLEKNSIKNNKTLLSIFNQYDINKDNIIDINEYENYLSEHIIDDKSIVEALSILINNDNKNKDNNLLIKSLIKNINSDNIVIIKYNFKQKNKIDIEEAFLNNKNLNDETKYKLLTQIKGAEIDYIQREHKEYTTYKEINDHFKYAINNHEIDLAMKYLNDYNIFQVLSADNKNLLDIIEENKNITQDEKNNINQKLSNILGYKGLTIKDYRESKAIINKLNSNNINKDSVIKNITTDNVLKIIKLYNLENQENLLEHFSKSEIYDSIINHIKECLFQLGDFNNVMKQYANSNLNGWGRSKASIITEIFTNTNLNDTNRKKYLDWIKNSINKSSNKIEFMNNYSNSNSNDFLYDVMNAKSLKSEEKKELILLIKNNIFNNLEKKNVYVKDLSEEFDKKLDDKLQNNYFIFNTDDLINILSAATKRDIEIKHKSTPANGKIDENFYQGNTGDCWLLASIFAMSRNKNTKKLLNKCIRKKINGDIEVTLKGVNQKFLITKEELKNNSQLAQGDLDVRAIELAISKYFADPQYYGFESNINGNTLSTGFSIILGIKGINEEIFDSKSWDKKIKEFNNPNYLTLVGSARETNVKDKNNNIIKIFPSHAYCICGRDDDYIKLSNPHDTSKTIEIHIDDFKKAFNKTCQIEVK